MDILYHVCNIHNWEEDGEHGTCLHKDLTVLEAPVRWLLKPSAPYKALENIVCSKHFRNDVPLLVLYCRTGAIEIFHSNVLKYRSKQIHYRMNSMKARTKVAILSHNSNVGRQQAMVHHKSSTSDEVGKSPLD